MSAAQNPFDFAAPPAGYPAPQQPQYAQPNPPYPMQQQPQQQQYAQPQQQQYVQPSQPPQQQQQLVVATQPSNPYAGFVAPQQQPVAQQQQASPWNAPAVPSPAPPPPVALTASAASFDPFAAPPPPAPAPEPVQAPPQQAYNAAPNPPAQDPWASAAPTQDPWASAAQSQSVSAPPPQQQYQAPAPPPTETQIVPAQPPQGYQNQGQSYGNSNSQIVPAGSKKENNRDKNWEENRDPRNPYSAALSQQVQGTKASGLPKAELVGKKGHVLSRISFRTIVMKKWKQSFWVQYGGHTMLWFRNQADFDDWLNNPYHTQLQRNFLIKLAINFVHDLYKPNVRGYQVTQCRTKPYGKGGKVVRQFKLERWMDYGPTIAAAFGSYDPKEVDACREAIVECMKNTPLDNGIRATGAVKEHHERKQQEEWQKSQSERQMQFSKNGGQQQNGGSNGYNNYAVDDINANKASVPDFDLLGTSNDDSASVPPASYASAPMGGVNPGALVPAVNPNAAYPGAPPAPSGNFAQPAFYPSAPAPPPMHQPQYPAQHQATDPYAYGAQAATSQGYPAQSQTQQQPQYQQQQQAQYPVQAPAPAFAQQPQPQSNYNSYSYPPQPPAQQPPAGGYAATYPPVPTQQF